ncbi:MAG TPA: hypothetical protein VEY51_00315 [Chondromyces sp.]|nr:hypothetical protein [Chondromyces sp.]
MWKKTCSFLIIAVVITSIIFDLKVGTLPHAESKKMKEKEVTAVTTSSIPFEEITIKGGDTVLTVAEQLHPEGLPVSIDQVIDDFEKLNDGLSPEKILIGRTYKIPVYE